MILTRADPALPLARLRASGELSEVRAADLRFTDEETRAFLSEATGLELTAQDVAALGDRTEGWIASLQLAAISLRDREDPTEFIAGFAGDDRYVVDYLMEEVLSEEREDVRDFLLSTAVLDRLCGPLCDALTASAGGAQVLEDLERRNLFVVALDDQRHWYRYHHLFGDVLRARLLQERPADVAELHRRASLWFTETGSPEDAVRHAMAAGDVQRAAELVELAVPEMRRERREGVLRRWARVMPYDVVRDRPVLALGLVGGLMSSNEFDEVGARLDDLDSMLDRPAEDLVVVDHTELPRVPGAVEMYRAALALVAGDLDTAIARADVALHKAAEGDDLTRAAASGLAGLASWGKGDIRSAHRAYTTCAAGLVRADHIADVLGCSLTLADMELALGRLGDAERTLEQALALAGRRGPGDGSVLRGTADMLVGLSRVAWHRNDIAAATPRAALRGTGRVRGAAPAPVPLAGRPRPAAGGAQDHAGALDLLEEAERAYVGDSSPQVHPIHATRARVHLAAATWARRGVGPPAPGRPEDALSYLREYEHITLARILLAQHTRDGAFRLALTEVTALLDRLLEAAETRRQGSAPCSRSRSWGRPVAAPRGRGRATCGDGAGGARWTSPSPTAGCGGSSTAVPALTLGPQEPGRAPSPAQPSCNGLARGPGPRSGRHLLRWVAERSASGVRCSSTR